MHWTMFKQSIGRFIDIHKEQWYHYAKNFSWISLSMYGVSVDKDAYDRAMKAAIDCKLENLDYMNNLDAEVPAYNI